MRNARSDCGPQNFPREIEFLKSKNVSDADNSFYPLMDWENLKVIRLHQKDIVRPQAIGWSGCFLTSFCRT
jgi:hypothetical protein